MVDSVQQEINNEIINTLWEKYKTLDFNINNMWNISIPKILTKILKNNFNLLNDSDTVQILKNNNTGEISIGWAYPEFKKRIDLIKHADDVTLARYIYLFSKQHYDSIEEIIEWLNESII